MRSKIFQEILDETPEDVEIFVRLYADLVVRINQLLREQNISKKELAERLYKKPSEISKWLNGEHNFTLRSLAKLSAELGQPLLEVPKKKTQAEFVEDGFICRMHTFISYTKIDPQTTEKDWLVADPTVPYNDLSHAG